MSLDISLVVSKPVEVFEANLTHNLVPMAAAAGIYDYIWRPWTVDVKKAGDLIEPLEAGLEKLKMAPKHFKGFEPTNGWGTYDHFVAWLVVYIEACKANPDSEVQVSG